MDQLGRDGVVQFSDEEEDADKALFNILIATQIWPEQTRNLPLYIAKIGWSHVSCNGGNAVRKISETLWQFVWSMEYRAA